MRLKATSYANRAKTENGSETGRLLKITIPAVKSHPFLYQMDLD